MYPISPIFADYLKRHDKQYIVKAIIDGQEYTSANIVEFTIENILAAADEFEIGTAIPSKLTIKLRLPEAIRPNAQVKPYIALSLDGMSWLDADYPWLEMNIPWVAGATEWLPLGEFYIDSREKVNEVWTYVCYDKLITADVAYISQLSYPATQKPYSTRYARAWAFLMTAAWTLTRPIGSKRVRRDILVAKSWPILRGPMVPASTWVRMALCASNVLQPTLLLYLT
ncbi:hypothetical protein [Paenibacillus thiaminolyticus]|uniref:hypothetical protein n=1 Tax=Paenibacillus thiaminolyticus TaxID=49283 RepID=UPI001F105688|nr:hypothetical protein [Paenibacillus thiaminolyticus]